MEEKQFLQEIIYNFMGFDSQFFQKVYVAEKEVDHIILGLSNVSQKFVELTKEWVKHPSAPQFQPSLGFRHSSFANYALVLPKIFYKTFKASHLVLEGFHSSLLLENILNYLHQYMTILHVLRIWSDQVSTFFVISSHEQESMKTSQQSKNFHANIGEEMNTITCSVHDLLTTLEQEFHFIELQLQGQVSLLQQANPLMLGKSTENAGYYSSGLTLLTFYQRCRKYDKFLTSLLGMIFNFHDNYDAVLAPNDSSLQGGNFAFPQQQRTFLQRYFNQISFLYQTEILLSKGEMLEYYPHFLSVNKGQTSSKSSSGKISQVYSHLRDNVDSLPPVHYYYLYMKQLFLQYVNAFTQQIMRSIWSHPNRTTIRPFLPQQRKQFLTAEHSLLSEWNHVNSLYDITMILRLLPASSMFHSLFQQIEYSIEDCEIIHKMAIPSVTDPLKLKKKQKNKKASRTSREQSLQERDFSRDKILEFIHCQSSQFAQRMLFPKEIDPWSRLLHDDSLTREKEEGVRVNHLSLTKHERIQLFFHHKNTIDYYLKYQEIQDLDHLYFSFLGEQSFTTPEAYVSIPQASIIEDILVGKNHYQEEYAKFVKALENHLQETSIARERSIARGVEEIDRWSPANEKESSPLSPFALYQESYHFQKHHLLSSAHQLHELFSTEHLQELFQLLEKKPTNSTISPSLAVRRDSTHRSNSLSVYQFIPFKMLYREHVLYPIRTQLLSIQQRSYQLIDTSFSFRQHLSFLQRLFLWQAPFHYDSLRELCHFYVFFLTSPSFTSAESVELLTEKPLLSANRRLFSSNPDENKFPFQSQRKAYELLTLQEFKTQEFHLLTSFQAAMTVFLEEELPKRGIQSYYCSFPMLTEFFRGKGNQSSASMLHSFDQVFTTLVQELRIDVFYQWPLSMILPSSLLQQFQRLYTYLFQLQILKWFSEFYWQCMIANNGLQIHAEQYQLMQQERRVQQRKQRGEINSSGLNRSPKRSPKDKSFLRRRNDLFEKKDGEDDDEEVEMANRKELVHLYHEEYDILLAKKQIQYQLLLFLTMMKCLYDYTQVFFHEYLWKECIDEMIFPSIKKNDGRKKQTIASIRYALEEMVEQMVDFYLVFQPFIQQLWKESFAAFQELRNCLVVETQYLYQHQQEKLRKLQKPSSSSNLEDPAPPISRNQRLIVFRVTEKAFEKLAKSLQHIYQMIEQKAKSTASRSMIVLPMMHSTTAAGRQQRVEREEEEFLKERKKKLLMFRVKIFEEMHQRLQGNFRF